MAIRCDDCIHNGVCYQQEVTDDIDAWIDKYGCVDYKPMEKKKTKTKGKKTDGYRVCPYCEKKYKSTRKMCNKCYNKKELVHQFWLECQEILNVL